MRELKQWIGSGPKSHVEAVPVFIKIVSVVDTMHRAHLRLCGLDPSRITILKNGGVKLKTQDEGFREATNGFTSFKYTAPELVLQAGQAAVPAAADSYAMGFMFYEILLGRNLFYQQFSEVARRGELGWMNWHADPSMRAKPLQELFDGFPATLSRLIGEMMEKDVAKRTVDLDGIVDSLTRSLQATAVLTGLAALRGDTRNRKGPRLGELRSMAKALFMRRAEI